MKLLLKFTLIIIILTKSIVYGANKSDFLQNEKIFFVKKRVATLDSTIVNSYHSEMFHGSARRPGAPYPLFEYCLGDDIKYPLHLNKNLYSLSDIFSPNLCFIVSERVYNTLKATKNIDFLKVEYQKVFNEKWKKGEIENHHFYDTDDLSSQYTHQPKLLSTAPDLYELITPIANRLPVSLQSGTLISVKSGESSVPIELNISTEAFSKYPIIWWDGYFMTENFYKLMKPFLDNNFYEVIECKKT